MTRQSKPKQRSVGLVVQQSASGELTVLDVRTQTAYALTKVSAAVWKCCDGKHSVALIAEKVAAELGLKHAEHAVEESLDQLERADLLAGLLPGLRTMTRRVALRTFAATAAGLAMFVRPRRVHAGAGPS